MKVGLSYSKCILDIVEGKVDMDDVLVVVSRTDFDPNDDEHWKAIWTGYTTRFFGAGDSWGDYDTSDKEAEKLFRDASLKLFNFGKLHQPRRFGSRPVKLGPMHWLETFLPSEELENNPTVKSAWDQFKFVAGLTGVEINTVNPFGHRDIL